MINTILTLLYLNYLYLNNLNKDEFKFYKK